MQALVAERRVRSSIAVDAHKYEALCPALRIPLIADVKAAQENPGGWTDASFTIPAALRRHGLETLPHSALDLPIWIMDGLTTVFHGVIAKVIPNDQGDLEVTCDGSYRLLGQTRMRSVWADIDLTQLTQAPGSATYASMSIDSSNRLVLAFPKDHAWKQGHYIAADYFLFNEAVGARDGKGVDSWKITIGNASTFQGTLEVRVYGMASPGDTTPVLIQTFGSTNLTRMQVSDSSHGADNGSPWPNTQYRCIRVGLYANADANGTPGSDFTAVIPTFQISTRGRVGVGLNTPQPSTSDIVKDVWQDGQSYDLHPYAVEEHASTTGGMITGNILDSAQKAFGIAFVDWSTPQEVVEAMVALDGGIAGMWGPTQNPRSAAKTVSAGNTTVNSWYRQPAELTYTAWASLSDPDYHVRLGKGAEWTPDGQPDDLVSADYVTYQSLKGKPFSVFTEDTSADNVTYEQGIHSAADWNIEPPLDTQSATTLGLTYAKQRRQPALSGTLTLYGDRPGSWELPGGGRGPRLYEFRPGVVRVVDAKGAKAGRITRLEYSARTPSTPETLALTVNSPAASLLDLQTARLAKRAAHHRHR